MDGDGLADVLVSFHGFILPSRKTIFHPTCLLCNFHVESDFGKRFYNRMDDYSPDAWLTAFAQFRARLAFVVSRQMNPLLSARLSVDDVLQETYLAVTRRLPFLLQDPEVPLYFKFRKITLQILADLEREHIKYEKRSTLRELSGESSDRAIDALRADVRSPKTILAHKERSALIRQQIDSLPGTDRRILILRNFDAMSNAECAAVLGINPKASSIRYVRALNRLRERLQALSEFAI